MGQPAEKIIDQLAEDVSLESAALESDQDQNKEIPEQKSADSVIKNYLRLLTWEELVEIASVFDATSMIPLTDFLTKEVLKNHIQNKSQEKVTEVKEDTSGQTNILPFKEVPIVEDSNQSDDYEFDKYDEELARAKDKNVIEVNKNGSFSIYDHEEELLRKKQELKKVNIGEFILKQKNKLKQCQKKLKKKEIYLLYKSSSSVDIHSNRNEDEKQNGIKTASNSGLLINKRQK